MSKRRQGPLTLAAVLAEIVRLIHPGRRADGPSRRIDRCDAEP